MSRYPRVEAIRNGELIYTPDKPCSKCGVLAPRSVTTCRCLYCCYVKLSDPNRTMAYQDDALKVAQRYGFSDIRACAAHLYQNGKTVAEISIMFEKSKDCIRRWVKDQGVKLAPSGGANKRKFDKWGALQVRFYAALGWTHAALAKEYNVSRGCIQHIISGKNYK